MKVPLTWLRDYVDVTLPVPQLIERLTLAGLEVSGVHVVGLPAPEGLHVKSADPGPVWDRDKLFVAQVLEVNRHPDADRLTLVTVDYGREPKQVVTGAPNIKVGDKGQKVIVALSGSVLYDGHAQGKVLKQLKPTRIRGVPSDAMVCSAKELGLSEEHEGIILLEEDAPVGAPLADFMGDVVIEIDVLPNMARCLSMIGVAREVAALTGQTLKLPRHIVQATGESIVAKIAIEIEDPALCGRYAGLLIRNIRTGAAPGWMQRRLQLAGMRPISNIVDITNYVMLEWGQPLHAFDYDQLVGRAGGQSPTIIVRTARPNEELTTLDGVKRKLTPENLLITDTAGPIAIAGVMGGADTEVSAQTKNILLESAGFNFISIRRTARALDLPSEASHRFSRGVHPETVRPAAERAAELMRQHASGVVCQGIADSYPAPVPPQTVALSMAEVRRILGIDFSTEEAARILTSLEFKVEPAGADALRVTTPPHRLDIQHGPADLIEELARIHGYDRLPATMLSDCLPTQHTNRPLVLEDRVRDILVNCGLQEVITYALTTPEKEAPVLGDYGTQPLTPTPLPESGSGAREEGYIHLANPISSERVVMRHSVLAGVLQVAASNLRHTEDVRLFEIGAVYLPRPGAKLPDEPRRLALVLTGPRTIESWIDPGKSAPVDFSDLKGVVEALMEELHLPGVGYRPAKRAHLHPGQTAEAVRKDEVLGCFGLLHPAVNEVYQLGKRAVLAGEFDLDAVLAATPARYAGLPVPEFPPVRQDMALVVDEATPAAQVAEEIRVAGGQMLRQVRLFDVYRGGNIPAGKKSFAYALTYQADDRTLTDKEVAKVHARIVARLEKVLGAQLRA